MKKLLYPLLFLASSAFGQASLGYYPWAGIVSVSSNPTRSVWVDARFQTNTLFGQLNTSLSPMVNLRQAASYQLYAGAGIQFSAVNAALGDGLLQGYLLHVGARVVPLASLPRVRVALEVSPYVVENFKSGLLYTRFGVVYHFQKKTER